MSEDKGFRITIEDLEGVNEKQVRPYSVGGIVHSTAKGVEVCQVNTRLT